MLTAVMALLAVGCTSGSTETTQPDSTATAAIGVPECNTLSQTGDPATDFSSSSKIGQQLAPLLGEPPGGQIVGYGLGPNIYGRVTVTVPFRDPETLATIAEIDRLFGGGDSICVELPPADYYDQPLEQASWTLLQSRPDSQTIIVQVGLSCGGRIVERMRPVQMDESGDQVAVRFELEHQIWGMAHDDMCMEAPTMVLELDAPLGDRQLVGCGSNNCRVSPIVQGTPTPVPPLPTTAKTANQLEELLINAGFADVIFNYAFDPNAGAVATWKDDLHLISLHQGDFRPPIEPGHVLIECAIGGLVIDNAVPEDAQQALKTISECS